MIVLVYSCKKLVSNSYPIITGYVLTDEVCNTVEIKGNPNNNDGNGKVNLYPNPATNSAYLHLDFLEINNAKVWIVKGAYYKKYKGDDTAKIDNYIKLVEKNNINSNSVMLNTESLKDGDYRVYVENNNKIYWINLIVEKN